MPTPSAEDEKPWLAHYDDGVPHFIEYKNISLPQILKSRAAEFPSHDALICKGRKISFKTLDNMAERFSASLAGFGIQKGDRVALILSNSIHCVVAYYGILRAGAVAVMNNPQYSNRELIYQLNDSGTKLVVTDDRLLEKIIEIRPKTKIKEIIYTSPADYLPFPKAMASHFSKGFRKAESISTIGKDVYKWKDVIENQVNYQGEEISLDDLAMYQYTGGTFGISKGVMLTHGNLTKQVQQISAWLHGLERGAELVLSALPLFHVFGLTAGMNLPIYMGWTSILLDNPKSDEIIKAISRHGATVAPMVPSMYMAMLENKGLTKRAMRSIKRFFSGGAPLPLDVLNDIESRTDKPLIEGFGLTEASPVTHFNPCLETKRKPGSIGIPLPDTMARIVDPFDAGIEMAACESGELVVKGPQVMKGYLNKPEATDQALSDGWLHTGDMAKMDDDGYFYIMGRKKDMVISGGYNVYPRDIEQVFSENPKVLEASAIGIPHPTRGEAVKVFVVLKNGQQATEEELIEYSGRSLARYKLPVEVEFRDNLPKTNVGKVLKKYLKDQDTKKRR